MGQEFWKTVFTKTANMIHGFFLILSAKPWPLAETVEKVCLMVSALHQV